MNAGSAETSTELGDDALFLLDAISGGGGDYAPPPHLAGEIDGFRSRGYIEAAGDGWQLTAAGRAAYEEALAALGRRQEEAFAARARNATSPMGLSQVAPAESETDQMAEDMGYVGHYFRG